MKRKYIDDIISIESTPYGYAKEVENNSKWVSQRDIYGFDEREVWSLDLTFFCWLYERLMMFIETTSSDLEKKTFIIDNTELTQRECIEKMISKCKQIITKENVRPISEIKEEVMAIWSKSYLYM